MRRWNQDNLVINSARSKLSKPNPLLSQQSSPNLLNSWVPLYVANLMFVVMFNFCLTTSSNRQCCSKATHEETNLPLLTSQQRRSADTTCRTPTGCSPFQRRSATRHHVGTRLVARLLNADRSPDTTSGPDWLSAWSLVVFSCLLLCVGLFVCLLALLVCLSAALHAYSRTFRGFVCLFVLLW